MKQDFTITREIADAIPAFLLVAERRSFRAAARELGVSPSALSQTIKALEARVGVALLHRTTRSVGLTQAGEKLLERAKPAFDGLRDAVEAARSLGGRPSGLLRINASRGVIASLIRLVLPSFIAAHPDIEVEIYADDGLADIVKEGFDAGFRLGESVQADMTAMRVSPPFRFAIAGSPAYFESRGRPQRPEELTGHSCIRFRHLTSQAISRWDFMDGNRALEITVDGPLIVNDTAVNIAAAVDGIGLCYVSEPLVEALVAERRLETVLEAFMPQTPGIFIYYPSRSQAMPKLRAFIDHIRQALADYERRRGPFARAP
jgi:DNA-binding transcriptional LysR family regulator